MTYKLVWGGEVIEEGLSLEEAEELKKEYEMAFKSSVKIKKERRKENV